jgi:hypothetical protein
VTGLVIVLAVAIAWYPSLTFLLRAEER